MIDPALFATGVAAGVAGDYLTDKFVSPPPNADPQVLMMQAMVRHLSEINRAISRSSHSDTVIQIAPAPIEYIVPDYDRDHLSILIPSQTTSGSAIATAQLLLTIPGVGQLTAYLAPGWTQLDLPAYTKMQTGDSNTYACVLSFRDDPLGAML